MYILSLCAFSLTLFIFGYFIFDMLLFMIHTAIFDATASKGLKTSGPVISYGGDHL